MNTDATLHKHIQYGFRLPIES